MRPRNIFWGEQFRRPDEEDIWEELKKMITNPPTEEEPKIEKEPYLTLEELGFEVPEEESFAGKKYNRPMRLQGEVNKIHYPNPYDAIQNNLDLSPEEKGVKIKELSNEIESQINREHVINKNLPDFKTQIKNGLQKEPRYDYVRNDINKFNIIENSKNGKTYEYQIANDKINGNKFYMVKDISRKNSSLTNWDQHPASRKNSNTIIPPTTQNLNPSQEAIQKPLSHNDWLEWLKRKRKNIGW